QERRRRRDHSCPSAPMAGDGRHQYTALQGVLRSWPGGNAGRQQTPPPAGGGDGERAGGLGFRGGREGGGAGGGGGGGAWGRGLARRARWGLPAGPGPSALKLLPLSGMESSGGLGFLSCWAVRGG